MTRPLPLPLLAAFALGTFAGTLLTSWLIWWRE